MFQTYDNNDFISKTNNLLILSKLTFYILIVCMKMQTWKGGRTRKFKQFFRE